MAQFGDMLAELRQDKRLTQGQLGSLIHVTAGTISNYENNAHYPDVEKLIELAEYFGVSIDYLLGRSTSNLSSDVFNEPFISGKTIGEFITDAKSLSSDRKRALLLLMHDMKLSTAIKQYNKKDDA